MIEIILLPVSVWYFYFVLVCLTISCHQGTINFNQTDLSTCLFVWESQINKDKIIKEDRLMLIGDITIIKPLQAVEEKS